MRYACIGSGWISKLKHLKHYCDQEHIEALAVVDSNLEAAKKTAEEFGIPHWYSSVNDCLDEIKPELISVCVPNFLHYPIVKEALSRGIHVHCEKPMAKNISEANEIAQLAAASSGILFTGMNKRYATFAKEMKSKIQDSSFGDIYSIDMTWIRKRGIPGKGGWFTNKELSGGGVLIDLGVHLIDLALYLTDFPEVTGIFGQADSYFMDEDVELTTWAPAQNTAPLSIDVEDTCVMMFTLKGRISVTIRLGWAANSIDTEQVSIACYGTKAGLFYNEETGLDYSIIQNGTPQVLKLQGPVDGEDEFNMQCANEIQNCLSCCHSGQSLSSADQAVQVMKIIDSVYTLSEKRSDKI